MLILIGIVPVFFALDINLKTEKINYSINQIDGLVREIDTTQLAATDRKKVAGILLMQNKLSKALKNTTNISQIPKAQRFDVRRDIMLIDRDWKDLLKKQDVRLSEVDNENVSENLKTLRTATDYSPTWVLFLVSASLGIGTMVGWKRIVKTIGEKIGKEHLTYAQGASAEMVAAGTIGLSSFWGWPVSTTQILSSSVAGSMVASKGVKNLQPATVRNILLTWALTLPVVVVLSGTLFLLFRSLF
jgi:PiT family inorganic phosphate transporter